MAITAKSTLGFVGTKDKAAASAATDHKVYFTNDTNQILVNGVIYGNKILTVNSTAPNASGDISFTGSELQWKNTSTEKISEKIGNMDKDIVALKSGGVASVTFSPSTIYKGQDQTFTATAKITFKNGETATSIALLDSSNAQVSSASNANSTSKSITLNTTNNTTTYKASAVFSGVTFTASANINARYPIIHGFGATPETVYSTGTKLSARTSASGKYGNMTNSQPAACKYYILVPSDIPAPTSFTMGGAPYVMLDKVLETINSISYNVIESGATYNVGASVDVTAA